MSAVLHLSMTESHAFVAIKLMHFLIRSHPIETADLDRSEHTSRGLQMVLQQDSRLHFGEGEGPDRANFLKEPK